MGGADPIVDVLNSTDVIVSYKSKLVLVCQYESTVKVARVYWRVESFTVGKTRFHDVNIPGWNGTVIYNINEARKHNIGEYTCLVENVVGKGEDRIRFDLIKGTHLTFLSR